MLPEIPIVSHFRYTCRYCLKKYASLTCYLLRVYRDIPANFTGISPPNSTGKPSILFLHKIFILFFCLKMYISSFANLQNKSSKWILKKKVLLGVGLELVTLGTWVSHSPSLPPHLLWKNRKKYVFKVHCHYFNVD